MLSDKSPVFDRMFNSIGFNQKEGSSPDSAVIVPDISAKIFRMMLLYIYTESVDVDEDNAEKLLYAG